MIIETLMGKPKFEICGIFKTYELIRKWVSFIPHFFLLTNKTVNINHR